MSTNNTQRGIGKPLCNPMIIYVHNIKTKTGRYKLGKEIQTELLKHGKIKLLSVDSVRIV